MMNAPLPAETTGRKYRSKKHRPCDLCRSRKIQCKLQVNDAACALCSRLDRRCTYVIGPLRRKSRLRLDGDSAGAAQSSDSQQLQLVDRPPGSMIADMTLPNDDAQTGTMQVDPFWMNGANPDQQLLRSPGGSNPLMMNWSTVDFLPDTNLDENLQAYLESHPVPGGGQTFADNISPGEGSNHISNGVGTASANTPIGRTPGEVNQGRRNSRVLSLSGSHATDNSPGLVDMGPGRNANQPLDWPDEFSLDFKEGLSSLFIGLSSESDPFLLRHYLYNVHDTYRMFRLHFRKVVDDADLPRRNYEEIMGQSHPPSGPIPAQFAMTDEEIFKDDIKAAENLFAGNSTEKQDMDLLNELVPPELESRLIRLYSQFVHPRYPVLSLSDVQRPLDSDCHLSIPIGIRSSVYALAAPFTFLDDELSVMKAYWQVPTEDLWAIAHRSFQRASRLAHLSLLQLCLLLLQMPPHNFAVAEPPSFWALSCSALAIAESLGLNLDPSSWRLPRSEVMLRRRLWWFTHKGHTWLALVCGRPSHINDSNWDVSPLTAADFEGPEHDDVDIRESILRQVPICIAQCELGLIAADILKEFYTLKANREMVPLSTLLTRAQPLRARIQSWRQSLPLLSKPTSDLSEDEFEDGAALRLSHLTLEILIFRALLRPLHFHSVAPTEASQEPISTIFENCYTCAKVASEIVSSLRSKHFTSFWFPYVRYQLCYVSSFVLMNLIQSTTEEMATRNKSLLGKWRDTLRTQARAWPLARLAAVRLDAIFWKGLSTVVHSAGPDSPAVQLFKGQGSRGSGEGQMVD